MALEQSIDNLTASIDKLIGLYTSGAAAAPAAAAGKAAGGKAAGGKAATKPKHTADQVKAKFQELRSREDIGAPPLKDLISTLGHADLAALLVAPDSFDAAMEGLLKIEQDADAASGGSGEDDL